LTPILSKTVLVQVVVSVLPVLVFLFALELIDTYKLLGIRRVMQMLAAGCATAAACYFVNTSFYRLGVPPDPWARFGAPLLEEVAKGAWVCWLIRASRIGFMVDAAISGFAVGAGFAVLENLLYVPDLAAAGFATAAIRGFGTAMMHGGATAILGVVSVNRAEMRGVIWFDTFAPGLAIAVSIHTLYNQPVLPPVTKAVALLILLPVLLSVVFWRSELALERWVGTKLDKDIDLLQIIATGDFSSSHAGKYLRSLESAFGALVLGDMLCYLQLSLELSAQAKGDLLRREMGFPVEKDPDQRVRLKELHYLERQLGRAGKIALTPLLGSSLRDIWDLHRMSKGSAA